MSDAEPIQTQETKKIILRWGDWEEEDKAAFKPPLPATLKEWQGYGFNEATHSMFWYPWEAFRDAFLKSGYVLYTRLRYQSGPRSGLIVPLEYATKEIPLNKHGVYEFWESDHGLYNPKTQLWFARTKDGIDVVLKVLSDGFDPDGLRELEILRKVSTEPLKSHPDNHCVPVLEFIEHGRWTFAVMPRWTGALDVDCKSIGNSEEALNFFCQVTSGLAFLHENRIAHLDIAAANIMVNYCGVRTSIRGLFPVRYGLIDFGNARMFPADCPADRLFVTDLFTGRHSMAPEVRLRQPYDPFAADVYQTAVLFFSYFYDVTAYVPGFHEVLLAMAEKSLKPSDRITMAEAHRRFCELRRKAPPTHQHEPIDITFWNHIPPRADMDAALVRRYLLKWKQKMARSDVKRKNTGVVSDAIWNEDWPPMDSL